MEATIFSPVFLTWNEKLIFVKMSSLKEVSESGKLHSPSAGDTLPSAVRTKCVILVFLAFLFWLPTSISILVVPWTSGHIMAMGAHDLAFEAESGMVESLCPTAVDEKVHQRKISNKERYCWVKYRM